MKGHRERPGDGLRALALKMDRATLAEQLRDADAACRIVKEMAAEVDAAWDRVDQARAAYDDERSPAGQMKAAKALAKDAGLQIQSATWSQAGGWVLCMVRV